MFEAKPNIGIMNALIRITFGLTIVAWSTAKLVKRPRSNSHLIMALLGAMKVGEGILKYCPVTELLEKGADNMEKQKGQGKSGTDNQ